MAKKKTEPKAVHPAADPNVMGLRGTVVEQPITSTLDENYMPYAMSAVSYTHLDVYKRQAFRTTQGMTR